MKIAGLLRRVGRWLWTGSYPEDSALLCSGYRSIEEQVRVMSDEEFSGYLKAHSRSHGKV